MIWTALALIALGASDLAGSNLSFKSAFLSEESGTTVPVARLSDIEGALGTTWHSLGKTTLGEVKPYYREWETAGVKWFRSYINWEDIEKGRKGNYAFPGDGTLENPVPDRLMHFYRELQRARIRPYGTLIGGNALYDSAYRSEKDFLRFAPDRPGRNYLSPDRYADFCAAFAARYKRYINHWELGNEPHNYGFCDYYSDGDKDTGKIWGPHYAAYFNKAAARIKQLQPEAKIISAGEDCGGLMSVRKYLPLIAANVDILAIHPYITEDDPHLPPIPERSYQYVVKPYLELASAHGIPEIWITELGWQAPHDTVPGPDVDPHSGSRTSRLGQAKYLARSLFFYPMRAKVKVVGQFSWRESNPEFSIRSKAVTAFNNIHAAIRGSDPKASLASFKGTTAEIRFAAPEDGRFSSLFENYLLVKTDKRAYLVFWIMKTQDDDFSKRKLDLTLSLPAISSIASVASHDILDGGRTTVDFALAGKELTLKNTWASDYPNLIEIALR